MGIVVIVAGILYVQYAKQEKILHPQISVTENASTNGMSTNDGTVKQKQATPAEPRDDTDQVIVIAVLIMIIPYSMYTYVVTRRTRKYEEEFIDFLYELSELLRGGLDPISAMKEVGSPTLGSGHSLRSLTPHLQKAAMQIEWGVSFEDVISNMADSLKSSLVTKYSYLIVQAAKLGAINTSIILKCADDLEKNMQLRREKEAELKEYIIIIYASEFILIGLIYMLNSTLLPSIMDMMSGFGGQAGSAMSFGLNMSSDMNIEKFRVAFFHTIMIGAFASGIIAGQLSEGKARHGLKHSVLLMVIGYIASLMFLIR
jgi:flagellar protein FlaJ